MIYKNINITTSNSIIKETVTINHIINLIIELDKKLISISKGIKSSDIDKLNDSRILFIKFISELNSNTILQFAFQAECYGKTKNKDWLIKRLPQYKDQIAKITDINMYSLNRNNNIITRIWDSFVLNYFYEFETLLRNIVRNLKKVKNLRKTKRQSYLTGNEPFYWIYRGLFENYLSFKKEDYEVLKIFSAIRNTIHNSGFYFPNSNTLKSFRYRGKTYNFKYGNPVNFITKEFSTNMLYDLLVLFNKILMDSKIKNTYLIQDPKALVAFRSKLPQ